MRSCTSTRCAGAPASTAPDERLAALPPDRPAPPGTTDARLSRYTSRRWSRGVPACRQVQPGRGVRPAIATFPARLAQVRPLGAGPVRSHICGPRPARSGPDRTDLTGRLSRRRGRTDSVSPPHGLCVPLGTFLRTLWATRSRERPRPGPHAPWLTHMSHRSQAVVSPDWPGLHCPRYTALKCRILAVYIWAERGNDCSARLAARSSPRLVFQLLQR